MRFSKALPSEKMFAIVDHFIIIMFRQINLILETVEQAFNFLSQIATLFPVNRTETKT